MSQNLLISKKAHGLENSKISLILANIIFQYLYIIKGN